eukprot:351557-Chlamydomonas_euryale.AAC.9
MAGHAHYSSTKRTLPTTDEPVPLCNQIEVDIASGCSFALHGGRSAVSSWFGSVVMTAKELQHTTFCGRSISRTTRARQGAARRGISTDIGVWMVRGFAKNFFCTCPFVLPRFLFPSPPWWPRPFPFPLFFPSLLWVQGLGFKWHLVVTAAGCERDEPLGWRRLSYNGHALERAPGCGREGVQ